MKPAQLQKLHAPAVTDGIGHRRIALRVRLYYALYRQLDEHSSAINTRSNSSTVKPKTTKQINITNQRVYYV